MSLRKSAPSQQGQNRRSEARPKNKCGFCRNHKIEAFTKNHTCKFKFDCPCLLCDLLRLKNEKMKAQQARWREIGRKFKSDGVKKCDKCRNHGILVDYAKHKNCKYKEDHNCEMCKSTDDRRKYTSVAMKYSRNKVTVAEKINGQLCDVDDDDEEEVVESDLQPESVIPCNSKSGLHQNLKSETPNFIPNCSPDAPGPPNLRGHQSTAQHYTLQNVSESAHAFLPYTLVKKTWTPSSEKFEGRSTDSGCPPSVLHPHSLWAKSKYVVPGNDPLPEQIYAMNLAQPSFGEHQSYCHVKDECSYQNSPVSKRSTQKPLYDQCHAHYFRDPSDRNYSTSCVNLSSVKSQ